MFFLAALILVVFSLHGIFLARNLLELHLNVSVFQLMVQPFLLSLLSFLVLR